MAASAIVRLVLAIAAARTGDLEPLSAFGLSVILPFSGLVLILSLGPSRTREGVLMRIGTAIQMILIVILPRFGLHLLLGLPVAFLVVEFFETRLPSRLRDPLARMAVR